LFRQPGACLFYEPLSNLVARLRVKMRAELKRLHRRLRTTAIYVTHDQEEAMTLGDRVVVMKDGTIQQIGRPLDVYQRPANRFVAGFVGMPPMNLIRGSIAGGVFDGEGVRVALPGRPDEAEVVLGIRPEHLSPRGALPLRVSVIEPLGDRQDVTLTTPTGFSLVARIDGAMELREGDEAGFSVDPSRVHVFDRHGARLETPELAEARP
jgi:multiple sugar transport system ATP-binding protein